MNLVKGFYKEMMSIAENNKIENITDHKINIEGEDFDYDFVRDKEDEDYSFIYIKNGVCSMITINFYVMSLYIKKQSKTIEYDVLILRGSTFELKRNPTDLDFEIADQMKEYAKKDKKMRMNFLLEKQ